MRKAICGAALTLAILAPATWAQNIAVSPANRLTALVPRMLVIQMPEPSSLALLGVDLLSVGALALIFRRRPSGNR